MAEASNDMTSVQGTIHYGGLYPQNVQSHGSVYLPPNTSLADDFHVYAIEWEASQVRACGNVLAGRQQPVALV